MMDECTFLGFKISTAYIYYNYKAWKSKSQDIFFNNSDCIRLKEVKYTKNGLKVSHILKNVGNRTVM